MAKQTLSKKRSHLSEKQRGGKGKKAYEDQRQRVNDLARIGCTNAEIMSLTGIGSTETLVRNFQNEINDGRNHIRESLRRKMIEKALDGDSNMLKWLSKQYLGFKEQPDTVIQVGEGSTVNVSSLSDDDLRNELME